MTFSKKEIHLKNYLAHSLPSPAPLSLSLLLNKKVRERNVVFGVWCTSHDLDPKDGSLQRAQLTSWVI
jgi:hypothetical protein